MGGNLILLLLWLMTKKTAIIIGSTSHTLSSLAIATKLQSTSSVEQNTLKCNSTWLLITIFTCTNGTTKMHHLIHLIILTSASNLIIVKLNPTHSYWLICGRGKFQNVAQQATQFKQCCQQEVIVLALLFWQTVYFP